LSGGVQLYSKDVSGVIRPFALNDDGSVNRLTPAALLDVAQTFTAGQAIAQGTLVDGLGIAVDAALTNNFQLELTQASTLANPTNVVPGMVINIAVRQNGVGGFTLGYGAAFKFAGGTPVVSTAPNAEDLISCYVRTAAAGVATVMLCSIAQDHT